MRRFLRTLLLAIGIWCLGGMSGLWFQPTNHEFSQEDLNEWEAMLTDFNASKIILNNLWVITIAFAGLLTGGITSVLILLFNGIIAVLFLKDFNIFELSAPWDVKYRFAYVVFEILALWISGAVGLLGFPHVIKFFKHSRFCFDNKEIGLIITAYFISIVLILIAGLLEADIIRMLTTQR